MLKYPHLCVLKSPFGIGETNIIDFYRCKDRKNLFAWVKKNT